MSRDPINELILRQVIREAIMQEYFYKWTSREVAGNLGRKMSSPGGSGGETSAIPGSGILASLKNTVFGKKLSKMPSSSAGILSKATSWVTKQKFLRLMGLTSATGLAAGTLISLLDTDDAQEDIAVDQTAVDETIAANRAIIEKTDIMTEAEDFARGISASNIETVEPFKLSSDLAELMTRLKISDRLAHLSRYLETGATNELTSATATSMRLDMPSINDVERKERADVITRVAASIDIHGKIVDKVEIVLEALNDSIENISDAAKKAQLTEVFKEFDRQAAAAIDISRYETLKEVIDESI